MVLYEDDGKGNLYLKYNYTPSAKEVINDIFLAPLEFGPNFQNKRRKDPILNDTTVIVDAPNLGIKAKETIKEEVESSPLFSFVETENNLTFNVKCDDEEKFSY